MTPRRGELGYAAWCIGQIEAGRCNCDGCHGRLVEERCDACGCQHVITTSGRSRYPGWIPNYDGCADAGRSMAEWRRQQDRDSRRKRAAESLGDPQQ